jgi:hypothetical protein
MEATIFEYLSSQGVFAVLFSGLLIYVLRMIKYREEQYFNSIKENEVILIEIRDELKKVNRKIPTE